ncbi:MAG: hypothetical protein ACLFVB_00935, partial [Thermoplasmata archaeon]
LKLSAKGSIEWNKTYGGEKGDCGYSIIETDDGSFITAGRTKYYRDSYILKFEDDDPIDGKDDDQNTGDTPFITTTMFFIITIFISIIMRKRK